MTAITIWGPWATAVAEELKSIETRTHNRLRSLVGSRIAIHAGKKWDARGARIIRDYLLWRGLDAARIHELIARARKDMGKVVCTAHCHAAGWLRATHSDAALCQCEPQGDKRLFGLFLSKVEKLERPAPAMGRQGIWNWRPDA